MFDRFLSGIVRLFRRDAPATQAAVRVPVPPVRTAAGVPPMPPNSADDPLDDVPRYPPFDSGMPVTDFRRVLARQQDLVIRIQRTAGVSRDDFETYYHQPIRNLARYVHLLPATDMENHSGPGGLLFYALELGLYSLQAAHGSVFPVAGGVERRFHMDPKWALATFLAGICSQLYRTVGNMVVLSREHEQWQPLLSPLYDWAAGTGTDRYFIRWLEPNQQAGVQASSAYLANLIVPREVMQYLALDNNLVLPAMSAAITGASAGDHPILRIINPITTRVRVEDMKRNPRHYGHMVIGAHLEPHLLDAMRRLVKTGRWTWNNPQAVIWVGADGVFLDWPACAPAVVTLLTQEGYSGIPRDPDTLNDLMAKVFEAPRRGGKYWSIMPPDAGRVLDGAVKLCNPAHIMPAEFDYEAHGAVSLVIAGAGSSKAQTAKPGGPPPKPPDPQGSLFREPTAAAPAGEAAPEPVVAPAPAAPFASPAGGDADAEPLPEAIPSTDGAHIDVDTGTGDLLRTEPPAGYEEPAPDAAAKPAPTPQAGKPVPGKKAGKPGSPARPAPPPPGQVQPRQAQPKPAKGAAAPEGPTLPGPSADRLLAMLKPNNAWLLKDIFASIEQGKLKGLVASLPEGLGISHEELVSHGRPTPDFIQELAERRWLWIDKTRQTRNLHGVEFQGKQYRMLILKPDIALGLGFRYEEPR